MKRDYHVELTVEETHSYIIPEVNSAEEAEEIAQQWLEEGEMGEVSGRDVFGIDTYPVEEEEAI